MYGYIYITTNNINGKKYIGKKSSSIYVESYLGSGKILLSAIKKYGKENFSNEIIEWCNSKEELNEREIYWIAFYDACNSEDFYNVSVGGEGGNVIAGYNEEEYKSFCQKCKHNKNTFIHKGDIEHKVAKDELQTYLDNGWEIGITEKHKQKISESKTGVKHKPHSVETRKKISEGNKGKKMSAESREKMSIKQKQKKMPKSYCVKLSKRMSGSGNPMFGKHHTEETKRKISEVRKEKFKTGEYVISEETRQKMSISHKGYTEGKDSLKGKICITKDKQNKYIFPNELEYYESLGYRKGRYLKKFNNDINKE